MHGHIGGKSQGANPLFVFKLWMVHGMTRIRQSSGIDTKELKRLSTKNKIVASRIFGCIGFGFRSKNPVSTPETARGWISENAKSGSGGIRFFGVEPKTMLAVLDENKS